MFYVMLWAAVLALGRGVVLHDWQWLAVGLVIVVSLGAGKT